MKYKLDSSTLFAFVFFCIALAYNEYIMRQRRKEGFYASGANPPFDVNKWLLNFQRASQNTPGTTPYDQWIGYMYQNPMKSTTALNDFKSRVFEPDCLFQRNWDTVLPEGMGRPMAASSSQNANIAYKSFLDCIAKGESACLKQLDNARTRFMEPGCSYKNLGTPSNFNKNFQAVFT